jgi:hypothetical protein
LIAQVTFDNEILPLLTKAGCNTGACHGAAIGRGGFRLSLYGQNPQQDWVSVARELQGRRVNPAHPGASLLLRKAGELMEHGGGQRLDPDGSDFAKLRDWIAAGAQRQPSSEPRLVGIEVTPQKLVIPALAADSEASRHTHQLSVAGRFDDDSIQDFTEYALLTPHDPAAVDIVGPGQFRVLRPGRHLIIVRVRNHVVACEVIAPTVSTPLASPANTPADENLIDHWTRLRLDLLGLQPVERAAPHVLLRRLMLDLCGRLPTPEESLAFLQGSEETFAERYEALVDRLLESPQSLEYWTYWLSNSLRTETLIKAGQDDRVAVSFRSFLREQLADQLSLPELMATLVEGDGSVSEQPAASFYLLANDARSQTETFSELMLGSRIRCANCHDHPLDQWTQDDYHGIAALFAGIRRGDRVQWQPGFSNIHPATGEPAIPRLPAGKPISAEVDPRPELASWIRGAGRSSVAANWCNRIWQQLMGIGLVDPVDDHRITNPATHPELLSELTEAWIEQHENPRWLIRQIVTSKTYQRATKPAKIQTAYAELPEATVSNRDALMRQAYGWRTEKQLPVAVLLDSVGDVTGVHQVAEEANEQQAVRFLQRVTLATAPARAGADTTCTADVVCELDVADSLAGRLAEITGPLINDRITHTDSRLRSWSRDAVEDAEDVIQRIYWRCFSRPATELETTFWCQEITAADDPQEVLEDLVWSLLTSPQFRFNW